MNDRESQNRNLQECLESLRIDPPMRPTQPAARRGRHPWLIVPLVALVVAAIAGGTYQSGFPNDAAVSDTSAMPVSARLVEPSTPEMPAAVLVASGRIVADRTVTVVARVPGRIVEVLVEQGDRVRRGQIIARVEEVEYSARRDRQDALLLEAIAAQEKAEHDLERTRGLREGDLVSPTEWVAVRTALTQAQARVSAARAGLRLERKRLDDCRITSPLSGTVLERFVEVGDLASPQGLRGTGIKTQLFTIADTRHLRVELDVSEQDIARIRAGMSCAVVPDAYRDRRYRGRVLRIDPLGNYGKGTVGVKVRIEEPDKSTRIGGGARVEFLLVGHSEDP